MKLKLAAIGFVVATLPNPAFAVEADAFADSLSSLFAQADFNVSFDSATLDGNDVVLDGVTAAPGGASPKEFDLTIVFKNVSETDDGGYTADRATIDRFVFEEDDVSVQLNGLVWENVLFHAEPPTDGLANIYHQSRLFTGPLRVLVKGEEVFRLAYMESGNIADEASETVSYSFTARGARLDMTKIEGVDDVPPMVDDFGLTVLNMEFGAQSVWNVSEGRMQVSDAFFDIGEIGRASFSAEILGYDSEFLTDLYAFQKASDEGVSEDTEEQVKQMASALFLNNAGLRFDDDGITNKLLDMAAEEQGMPRAAMTIGFAAALPIFASEIGVSEALQTSLLQAATDYMINPRSIEVQLDTNKPVRFSRLAAAIEDEDAEALIGMFNFIVTANQD